MSNIYGRIPAAEAFKILKKYFPNLKEKEFKKFLKAKINLTDQFFLYEDNLINSCFISILNGDKIFTEKYLHLVENQEKHRNHFYFPKKEELLKYKNEFYYEDSLELNRLVSLVTKNLKQLSFTPSYDDIALDILSPLKTEANLDEALLNLSRIIEFSNDSAENNRLLETISKMLKPVYRKTRMWFLCGFSPEEFGK